MTLPVPNYPLETKPNNLARVDKYGNLIVEPSLLYIIDPTKNLEDLGFFKKLAYQEKIESHIHNLVETFCKYFTNIYHFLLRKYIWNYPRTDGLKLI